jgi:hypothetical protein
MKNMKLILSLFGAAALLATASITMMGCEDDDAPPALTLSTLTAGSIDLNAVTSATGVPTAPTITATFSTDLDPATVTTSNITLTRDYDGTQLPITVSASGNTVTITPDDELGTGTMYELSLGTGLMSDKGKALASSVERNFSTEGSFAPAGVIAHYTFENSPEDVVGSYDPTASDVVAIEYLDSRNTAAGKAASFNGTTSLIEIPNADDFMDYDDFAISFWIKPTFTDGKGQFVLGLAGAYGFQFEIPGDWTWVKMAINYEIPTGRDAEDSWYPGNGETKDNGGFQGWTVNKDVTPPGVGDTYFKDKWAHVVVTYDAASKVNSMYINGELVKQHDFDLFPADNPKKNAMGVLYSGNAAPGNELALGFIQARENRKLSDSWADYSVEANNHFKGLMDDVRIFSVPITAAEVALLYNSEKP